MSGIYIHIPFCRKRCHYCDFYTLTAIDQKPRFLEALKTETELRKAYLHSTTVQTIYLGGGTPSVLSPRELSDILDQLNRNFSIDPHAEVTLEANPDDLNREFLTDLRSIGFNRLSMGIQSFSDGDLKKMNRRHTAEQAVTAVHDAADAGFNHISIDLIYGLPGLSIDQWRKNLQRALKLPVEHISSYHLTYHEGTRFYDWLHSGRLRELPEDDSLEQFNLMMELLTEAGYEHYEISNFALNGAYSKHNSSYWDGTSYLGLGPSAHSYNGASRQWNVASLARYTAALTAGGSYFDFEELTETEKLNDYIITRLRTQWGISLAHIQQSFGVSFSNSVLASAGKYLSTGKLKQEGSILTLTREGIMVSDKILLDLVV